MPKSKDTRKRKGDDAPKAIAAGAAGRAREIWAVVDRVEDGGTAVLSLNGGKRMLDLPLSRLPEGTTDGDHLRLTFDGEPGAGTLKKASKDERSRAAAEDRIGKLQERLARLGGTEGKKDFKL